MDQPLKELPALTSLRQVAASERKIALLLRRRQRNTLRANAAKAQIDQKLAQVLAPVERDIFERAARIEEFASSSRGRLTRDGKLKTIELPHHAGEFRWVFSPPALFVANVKNAIASIRRKGLGAKRFLRVIYELDKEALGKAPEIARKVDGVSIRQDERFVIAPSNVPEKVEKNLTTGQWSIHTPKKKELQE